MKKFKFSLDSVLSYKQQVLDSLKGEHAAILAQVREQEDVLEAVWQDYRDCNEEYRQRKLEGITVADAMFYQNGLRALEAEIERETAALEELRKKEEAKRPERDNWMSAQEAKDYGIIDMVITSHDVK